MGAVRSLAVRLLVAGALVAVLLPVALPARRVMACSCAARDYAQLVAESDAVFTGRMLEDAAFGQPGEAEVLERVKGADAPTIMVRDGPGSCAVGLAKGNTYRFFLFRNPAGELTTVNCWTQLVAHAEPSPTPSPVRAAERPPATGEQIIVSPQTGGDDDAGWWAYPFVVAVSLAAAGLVLWTGGRR